MRTRAAGQPSIVGAAAVDFKAMYGYQHIFLKKTLGIVGIFVSVSGGCLYLSLLLSSILRARERHILQLFSSASNGVYMSFAS